MRDKSKQKVYLKERVKGNSIRKAAAAANVSRKTAERAEKDPEIKSAMRRALDKVGADDKKIARTVFEGLDATKVISANIINQAGDGHADANSMTKDFIDVPDYQSRIKAAELAGKFRGDFIERSQVDLNANMKMIIESVDYSAMVKKR
jgi:hypothetical protein